MLGRAALFSTLLALVGCDHVIVEHGAGGLTPDGGGPSSRPDARTADAAVDSCRDADDGTACDDHDVCSPSSMCVAGECVGGSAFDSCVVADTLEDFGEVQGEDAWYYGYWNADADPDGSYQSDDFTPMELCAEERIWMPPGRCDTIQSDPGYRWTRVLDWALSHPETRPETELPIRRWVSDVSGPARISVYHWLSGSTGDGTRALLVIDGVERWRNDAPAGDSEGTRDTLEVELREGTIIDQIVHPVGTSADDMTHFSMIVEGR